METAGLGVRAASFAWSAASRLAWAVSPPPVRVEGIRVVSVGAIAAGGAGKTPLAIEIAARLCDRGIPTAIVLRGYGGAASEAGALVSDGLRVLLGARAAGDEAVLAARRVPGVVVRVGVDRVRAVERARADGARAVVIDDGFQTRSLARDVDVVAIDDGPHPAVVHRESPRALGRATILAVRGATSLPQDSRGVAWTLDPEAIVDADLCTVGAPEALAGSRVVVACGVARPERVAAGVRALGATVVDTVFAWDHRPVAQRAARAFAHASADRIVTTEKDLVREPAAWARLPAWAVRVRAVLGPGRERLEALLEEP